nr:hypothetical protein [Rhodoferax sp.]
MIKLLQATGENKTTRVPYFSYAGERDMLDDWAIKKGGEELPNYWEEKTQLSIDKIPTHIIKKMFNREKYLIMEEQNT